jgi:hypothetical protein
MSCDQRQIRDRGRHQSLKERLLAASVSRLAHAQLDHPGNSVLNLQQLPGVFVVIGVASHYIDRCYQLLLGIYCQTQLVAIETLVPALPSMPHLGIVYRGDAASAGPFPEANSPAPDFVNAFETPRC